MKNNVSRQLAISLLGLCLTSYVCGQEGAAKKCKSQVMDGKYKRSEIAAWYRQPDHVSGSVLVSPKNLDRKFLVQLSKRLKSEYCTATFLKIAIYDNAEKMDFGWEIYNKSTDAVRSRALYIFDKKANIEMIEFFETAGDTATKVQIDLTKFEP